MINHGENLPVTIVEHLRGGAGEVYVKDLTLGRKPVNLRMFSEMILLKGCSIGTHTHAGDGEIIYILSGEGIYFDGNAESPVRAGDALVCCSGESHALRNERDMPLKYLACIIME